MTKWLHIVLTQHPDIFLKGTDLWTRAQALKLISSCVAAYYLSNYDKVSTKSLWTFTQNLELSGTVHVCGPQPRL